jgi:membrane-associated phospholipid phosphatase
LENINPVEFILITFASFISLLFHPMLISAFTFAVLIYSEKSSTQSPHLIFFIALLFSTLLSIAMVMYLRKKGIVSDADVSAREQRVKPLMIGALFNGIGFLVLRYMDASVLVQGLMFCYAFNTMIISFISRYWKISIHAIGLSGPLVALWLFGVQFPVFMILAMVLLGVSRVILKSHTPAQVLAGTFLGLGLAYFQLTFLFLS